MVVGGLATLAFVVLADGVRADDQICGDKARSWATSCAGAGKPVDADRCPRGHIIFSVPTDGAPVFVDAASDGSGLRKVGSVGLSPIGSFDDFSTAPQPVQDAFARVVACVEWAPSLPFGQRIETPSTDQRRGIPVLWRIAAGLAAGLVVASMAMLRRRSYRRQRGAPSSRTNSPPPNSRT
jgi:catechol 2,3-dioxygenase-like lactoylglutathione lyase family enzyme